jgi:RNA polymerase sigma-70 factor, ECF subfamily
MDIDEFERQCKAHHRALMAYAFTCCRQLDAAEDIVQETMLIAMQKRDQYFPEADLGAWMISIARNVWRREQDRRRISARAARFIEANASIIFDPKYYDEDRWTMERTALAACMEKLQAEDKDIIRSHFGGSRKYAEIAESARRTVAWVKVRMFRARKSLMDCVQRSIGEDQGTVNEA